MTAGHDAGPPQERQRVMSISPGSRLGSYEVIDALGAGGMGEVFRARDTALRRDAAVKVLPQAFIADADRLARFKREAEILASLNHPNIAQIYGLEESDGITAIVMELIEGPTLADRIAQGPIPPDEAVSIGLQVVAALEAAHAKQIVHRDLKPANIKLRRDGTVKVLDFGISKPIDASATSGSQVKATPAVTETGVILGTAAYMSPEQARGRFVDERTDIWAFGCLLFEMLTAQPAFGGEDMMATLARVIDRAADLSAVPKAISPAVRHTIKLCLEKDLAKRIADIRDVRLALEGRFESELTRDVVAAATRKRSRFVDAGIALVAGGALMAAVGAALWPDPPPRPERRTRITLAAELDARGGRHLALSSDGLRVAYSTAAGIYLHDLEASLEPALIRGTTGNMTVPRFTSNDSELIYRTTLEEGATGMSTVESIALEGGPSTTLIDNSVLEPAGIAAATSIVPTAAGTYLVSHVGGVAEYDPAGGGRIARRLALGRASAAIGAFLLPDEDTVLYTVLEPDPSADGAMMSASIMAARLSADGQSVADPILILPRASDPRYLAQTGHLLFERDGVVHAIAFDPATVSTSGSAQAVLPDVLRSPLGADYDVAANGTLAYIQDLNGQSSDVTGSMNLRLRWHYADGRVEALELPAPPFLAAGYFQFPVLSPDNTKLAVTAASAENDLDVWVYDLRSGAPTSIARTAAAEYRAVWTPDGESLIFFRSGSGLMRRKADASDGEELLLPAQEGIDAMVPDWVHPNGTELVFTAVRPSGAGLYRLALTPGAQVELLLDDPDYDESASSLSRDGRYLAYQTTESGVSEIRIRPYPDVNSDSLTVSADGGTDPLWDTRDEFLYFAEDRPQAALIRVAVDTDASGLVRRSSEVVTERSFLALPTMRRKLAHDTDADRWLGYSYQPRGNRNLNAETIVLIENWTEWLRREVPID